MIAVKYFDKAVEGMFRIIKGNMDGIVYLLLPVALLREARGYKTIDDDEQQEFFHECDRFFQK